MLFCLQPYDVGLSRRIIVYFSAFYCLTVAYLLGCWCNKIFRSYWVYNSKLQRFASEVIIQHANTIIHPKFQPLDVIMRRTSGWLNSSHHFPVYSLEVVRTVCVSPPF